MNEYTAPAGGRLKLKGVQSSRVEKKKSKKKIRDKEKEKEKEKEKDKAKASSSSGELCATAAEADSGTHEEPGHSTKEGGSSSGEDESRANKQYEYGKTAAERRFEERKRRRLDERLMKEGVKSHKERVEDFNRYLANLSEHHDMWVVPCFHPTLLYLACYLSYLMSWLTADVLRWCCTGRESVPGKALFLSGYVRSWGFPGFEALVIPTPIHIPDPLNDPTRTTYIPKL